MSESPGPPRRNGRGFTLVELLVVVAIIALLVAILLPALGKARALARKIACQSNIRQIGSAIFAYCDDYHDRIPRNPYPLWYQVFLPYLDMKTDDVTETEVYRCPAFPRDDQYVCYVISSWTFNGRDDYFGYETSVPTPLSQFDRPANTIYVADNEHGDWRPIIPGEETGRNDVWHVSHMASSDVVDDRLHGRRVSNDRHDDGTNCWYLDGHVGWVPAETMTVDMWRDTWD